MLTLKMLSLVVALSLSIVIVNAMICRRVVELGPIIFVWAMTVTLFVACVLGWM